MKFEIDNYIYDSDYQIIYDKSLSSDQYAELIKNDIIDDEYSNSLRGLKYAKQHQKNFRYKVIKQAGIVLSFDCKLRCNYCSQDSVEGSKYKLVLEDIKEFLRDVIKKRIISSIITKTKAELNLYFTGGGEPTYDWELFVSSVELSKKMCKDNNVRLVLGMTTNGLLSIKQQKYIADNFNSVLVSYDGLPEIQNVNRPTANNNATSKIVESSIKYFSEHGIKTTIRTTIWHHDFDRLHEMYDYISGKFPNICSWDINPVTAAGRAVHTFENQKHVYDEMDFVVSFIKLLKYANLKKDALRLTSPLLSCEPISFSCGGSGWNTQGLWLFPDGKITTCIDSSDIVTEVGCIKDDKLMFYDSYEDPLLDMGIIKFQQCKNCIAFRVCGAGCPIKHIRQKQNESGMLDWECKMEQKYWVHILRTLISEKKEYLGWKATSLNESPILKNKIAYKLNYINT